ncbi:MAG: hypothetical protein WAL12_21755, partial [Trebonia sp.]
MTIRPRSWHHLPWGRTDREGNSGVMRNWQATPSAGPAPPAGQDLLFTPGPRLGWVFRDRRELAAPYPEPEPSPHAVHAQAV